ncbi:MAG: type II toxin-antitoxin system ParD family antitoxin [Spirulinaceae cyanobacterium]
MKISLTSERQQWVEDKVQSGRYQSVSEVIEEGLRLLEERDRVYQNRLAELQAQIDVGIQQLDRGERVDGKAVIERLLAKNRSDD